MGGGSGSWGDPPRKKTNNPPAVPREGWRGLAAPRMWICAGGCAVERGCFGGEGKCGLLGWGGALAGAGGGSWGWGVPTGAGGIPAGIGGVQPGLRGGSSGWEGSSWGWGVPARAGGVQLGLGASSERAEGTSAQPGRQPPGGGAGAGGSAERPQLRPAERRGGGRARPGNRLWSPGRTRPPGRNEEGAEAESLLSQPCLALNTHMAT